ncbi:MAG: diaminopimelate epimerase [Candidatus Omnitrophota bacterium]
MKISFTKMSASGNDFVVIENRGLTCRDRPLCLSVKRIISFSKQICDRKYGIGADGVLFLEKSKKADVRMRIFNADGSEAEMCGNGARCAALWINSRLTTHDSQLLKIETKAGIIESVVEADNVKIKLTGLKGIKTGIPLKINNRNIKVDFINTGVPHIVIFVEGLEKIDVFNLGRAIRYHNKFKPAGTNVDFVEIINEDSIKVRSYERGVEDETLACGTGSAASALLYAKRYPLSAIHKVNVYTKGGEILKVYFDKMDNRFYNVWLEGKAKIVYKGEYYV